MEKIQGGPSSSFDDKVKLVLKSIQNVEDRNVPMKIRLSWAELAKFEEIPALQNFFEKEKYNISRVRLLCYLTFPNRHPFCSYNSITSELVVHLIPNAIHQTLPSLFLQQLYGSFDGIGHIRKKVSVSTALHFNGFSGKYAGSIKIPDLAVAFSDLKGDDLLKLVVKVGFSESYEDLIEDAKLWLEGLNTVNVVVLAKFLEDPSYEDPLSSLSKEKQCQFYHGNKGGIGAGDVTLVGTQGPAEYGGYSGWGESVWHSLRYGPEMWPRVMLKEGDRDQYASDFQSQCSQLTDLSS